MIEKLLVANRGEIAVRAFRAANELGVRSVAIYAPEDRDSVHRLKADESYEIGSPGRPVSTYLDSELIVATAVRVKADSIYPGYGFMSESAVLASRCEEAGLRFVGPPPAVLELAGDKTTAREVARRAGVRVLEATGPIEVAQAREAGEVIGFPLFVKAAMGGGGRGMRLVHAAEDLEDAVTAATHEAEAAFADGTVYLERAMLPARHIEVQLLADAAGSIVHLFERDCSVQRRHQKVIEITPAPNLDPVLRLEICDAAIAIGREIGYVNAGTVEFLVGEDGDFAFIELNPRIQVEHTVTEETTDIDLVRSQILIASGATLAELGIAQESIVQRGTALQCRVTTENPANGFRPDAGRIIAYRSPGGAGIRLDEGSAFVGAEVSPFFDPLLVKVTARGPSLQSAAARARRAIAELRVRGVSTNQSFLLALLRHPAFLAGHTHTAFIDEHPDLIQAAQGADRASRLLTRLTELTVNREREPPPVPPLEPRAKLPEPPAGDPPSGSRQALLELGPAGFAAALRAQTPIAVTDTTMRDAHQSLLATRMRTFDMLAAAPVIAHRLPGLLSLECWGGATFDVALRFLNESPWERLERLRVAVPNICLQMLLRGRNLLAYNRFEHEVVRAFVGAAVESGIDVIRIFDALNDIDGVAGAIEAALDTPALIEGSLCYTSDLSDPNERIYTLDYYLRLAEQLVDAGVHVLAIKDMAGLLRAPAAHTLISALRERFDAPVHLHTHDTAGGALATYLAAAEAGVDALDGASAPLAGMTSQPSLAAILAAFAGGDRAPEVSLDEALAIEPYWEAVRVLYSPFEAGLQAPTGRVYRHQIPGGQLSNLRHQAEAVGVGGRFEEIELAYERANALLGDIIKVTPTSKVVGDLALFAVSSGIDFDELEREPARFDLPDSVLDFLRGGLGQPAAGLPQPFTERALAGRPEPTPPAPLEDAERAALEGGGRGRQDALARIMFPGPFDDYREARTQHGDVSLLPTTAFFYGLREDEALEVDLAPGVRVIFELEAIGEPDEGGVRTVMARVNGQLRPVDVRDRTIEVLEQQNERADPREPGHVAAPVIGAVIISVEPGQRVEAGQPVAVIEAMKMESTISAPIGGTVERVAADDGTRVERGDLLLVLRPA